MPRNSIPSWFRIGQTVRIKTLRFKGRLDIYKVGEVFKIEKTNHSSIGTDECVLDGPKSIPWGRRWIFTYKNLKPTNNTEEDIYDLLDALP